MYRILLSSDFAFPEFGGVERHIHVLGQALAMRGHTVHVLTARKGLRVREMIHDGLHYHYLPLCSVCGGGSIPSFLVEFLCLWRLQRAYNFDVIHCHQSYSLLALLSAAFGTIRGIPVVYTDHSLSVRAAWYERLLTPLRKAFLLPVQASIYVSEACKENALVERGIPRSKIVRVIGNPVVASFPMLIGHSTPTQILFVQRMTERKGADMIPAIIRHLAMQKHEYIIHIVGSPVPASLTELAKKEEARVHVLIHGERPHTFVETLLKTCSVAVIPSRIEAFSIFLVEALQVGCITVCTRVGGATAVYESISPALARRFLCEPQADAIAKKIAEACAFDDRKLRLCAALQARSLYAPDAIAAEVESVYREVMAQRPTLLQGLRMILQGPIDIFIVRFWLILQISIWWVILKVLDLISDKNRK